MGPARLASCRRRQVSARVGMIAPSRAARKTRATRPPRESAAEAPAVEEVADPWLRRLLDLCMEDEGFRTRLLNAPGAKSLHHAHVGGLVEHTLSVVHIVRSVCHLYPQMNADLLITGALLHDIGKTEELEGLLAVDYSDEGNFLGHVVLTDRMVGEKLRMIPDFPPHLANLLCHMLISHHGEREWGAPVVPKTMEACALHYADNLDARLQGFRQVIEAGAANGGSWSPYISSYQRTLYVGPNTADGDGPERPDQ